MALVGTPARIEVAHGGRGVVGGVEDGNYGFVHRVHPCAGSIDREGGVRSRRSLDRCLLLAQADRLRVRSRVRTRVMRTSSFSTRRRSTTSDSSTTGMMVVSPSSRTGGMLSTTPPDRHPLDVDALAGEHLVDELVVQLRLHVDANGPQDSLATVTTSSSARSGMLISSCHAHADQDAAP